MNYYINPQVQKDIDELHRLVTPTMRYARLINNLNATFSDFGRRLGEYVVSAKEFQEAASRVFTPKEAE